MRLPTPEEVARALKVPDVEIPEHELTYFGQFLRAMLGVRRVPGVRAVLVAGPDTLRVWVEECDEALYYKILEAAGPIETHIHELRGEPLEDALREALDE